MDASGCLVTWISLIVGRKVRLADSPNTLNVHNLINLTQRTIVKQWIAMFRHFEAADSDLKETRTQCTSPVTMYVWHAGVSYFIFFLCMYCTYIWYICMHIVYMNVCITYIIWAFHKWDTVILLYVCMYVCMCVCMNKIPLCSTFITV